MPIYLTCNMNNHSAFHGNVASSTSSADFNHFDCAMKTHRVTLVAQNISSIFFKYLRPVSYFNITKVFLIICKRTKKNYLQIQNRISRYFSMEKELSQSYFFFRFNYNFDIPDNPGSVRPKSII